MELRDRKFLITGGFSLIGSHTADKLLEAGAAEVILFDNGSVGTAATIEHLKSNPRVRIVLGDILRMNQVLEALDGVDGVFQTATFITLPLSQNIWTGMDVNVRGLMTVLEACRWRGVKKLVYSSSIAAFGNSHDREVTEESPYVGAGVQPVSALYGIGKLMGEQLCAFFRERYGVDYVSLRFSTVYGERQHYRGINVLPIVEAYDRIKQGLPPLIDGDGSEVHDYVYVGDVARAQLRAMASDVSGEIFTIASGIPTSLNELVRLVLRHCGSTLEPEHRSDATKVKSAGATVKRFNRDKAAALLGWTPEVSLAEGIGRLIAWREAAKARGAKA